MTNIAIPTLALGMGFSSNKQMGTSTFCVDTSTIKNHGKLSSTVEMKYGMSSSEVSDYLNIGGDADVFDAANVEVGFVKNIKDTAYSTSFSFMNMVKFPTQILYIEKYGENTLNEFGKAAFNQGLNIFKDVCGDKFVIQENRGAYLFATFKLTFKSKWKMKSFTASVATSSDAFNAALDFGNDNTDENFSIELHALQVGGDVMRLANIFKSQEAQDATETGELSAVLKCGLKNQDEIDMCKTTLNNIIRYAENDFATQVSIQVDSDKSPPSSKNYVFADYKNIGIAAMDPVQFAEDKRYFLLLNERLETIKLTVDNILGSSITDTIEQTLADSPWSVTWTWNPKLLDVETSVQLQYAKLLAIKLETRLHSKSSGVLLCFQNPEKCSEVRQSITDILDYEDGGKESKPATQIMNVNTTLDYISPFSILSKVYIMNVDCNKQQESSIENMYYSRVLLPTGLGSYYEDSQFQKIEQEATVTNRFYNSYEIAVNTDKTKITSMKVTSITDQILSPQECGELDINDPNALVPYYEKILLNVGDESAGCIKALCLATDYDLTEIDSIGIALYEYDSPL